MRQPRKQPLKKNSDYIHRNYIKITSIIASCETNNHYEACLTIIENFIKSGCILLEKDLLTFWGRETLQRTTQHLKNAYDEIKFYLKINS